MLLSQAGGPLPTGGDVRKFVLTSCQHLYHSTVLTSCQYGRRKNSCRVGRWFCWDQRRSRPARWFPARLRAGARLSPEKAGRKSAGGNAPWTPFFMARSLALARFGVGWRIVPVVGLFRHPSACPDLETFFHKNAFQHIFYSKMRPRSVLAYRK